MKKIFLAFLLACLLAAACTAQAEAPLYKVGDVIEDFPISLVDGEETTLYALLEEKDAVLINLWASWCGPCRMEFPYMQEAYLAMQDEIGLVALSTYEGDTPDAIRAFREELGVPALPMGQDSSNFYSRTGQSGIPVNIIVDRFGVICFLQAGAVTSTAQFEALFSEFTGDDYTQSRLLETLPEVPLPEAADPAELNRILSGDERLAFSSTGDAWPFLPAEDGASLSPSGADTPYAVSVLQLEFEANAGDALTYECRAKGDGFNDKMQVLSAAGDVVFHASASDEWIEGCLSIETDGKQTVLFAYQRGSMGSDVLCDLRNVRLLSGSEAENARAASAARLPVSADLETYALEIGGEHEELFLEIDGAPVRESAVRYFRVPQGPLELKFTLGAACDPRTAYFYTVTDDNRGTFFSSLASDGSAYLHHTELSASAYGTMIKVAPGHQAEEFFSPDHMLMTDAAEATRFLVMQLLYSGATDQESMPVYRLLHADGTEFASSANFNWETGEVMESEAPAEAETDGAYIVRYTDENSNPIEGVLTQFCDAHSCSVVTSDANGEAVFYGMPFSYEAHMLMPPEGYAADDTVHLFPEEGGRIEVVLHKE